MKSNKIYFSILSTLLLIGASLAWMITGASRGELVEYGRHLVLNSLDIDVGMYKLIGSEYVLVTEPMMSISNLAPGESEQFRIDFTNNGNTPASTRIIFTDITGDIVALKDKLIVGISSPIVEKYYLTDNLFLSENDKQNYMFKENFEVEAESSISIYWYLSIDQTASNEVAGKTLTIDTISFIKP